MRNSWFFSDFQELQTQQKALGSAASPRDKIQKLRYFDSFFSERKHPQDATAFNLQFEDEKIQPDTATLKDY